MNKKKQNSLKTIGILGAGQLARMLAIKAEALGMPLLVLSKNPQDPAAQLPSAQWIQGDLYQPKDLTSFLKQIDILSFESEFIPALYIQSIIKKLKSKHPVIAPSLKALSLIQDRYHQKKLISKYQLQTSPFVKWQLSNQTTELQSTKNKEAKKSTTKTQATKLQATKNQPEKLRSTKKQIDFSNQKLLQLFKKLGPFVLKTRMGGYDGYGTFVFKNQKDCDSTLLFQASSLNFIAEKWIPFKRELALIAVRNKKGQIVFTPLIESYQKDSRCFWVKGPVKHKKLSALKIKIKKLLEGLNYQGALAFELFDTGDQLIINELAPRVHNSGHYSLDALTEDQFTLHLKGISNLPLKTPQPLSKAFAMLNLLGFTTNQADKEKIQWSKATAKHKDISCWWYEKTESRLGRKMGHINTCDSSMTKALSKLLKIHQKVLKKPHKA